MVSAALPRHARVRPADPATPYPKKAESLLRIVLCTEMLRRT
jgi:hypothetical protein